jgi:transcriptional regulator
MYVQNLFAETRPKALFSLIADHPLGAVISMQPSVEIDHLPFSVHPELGPAGVLRCHSARANPLWPALQTDGAVTVVFQSPSAYISPSWMPGRRKHGKVAPSWNYAAVHVYGRARIIEEAMWLRQHLQDLIAAQEIHRNDAWSLDEAPPDFVAQLLEHIVGIEIQVERLVGKWFVGQQRSPNDRAGVVAGLLKEGTDASDTIAALMQAHAPEPPMR